MYHASLIEDSIDLSVKSSMVNVIDKGILCFPTYPFPDDNSSLD